MMCCNVHCTKSRMTHKVDADVIVFMPEAFTDAAIGCQLMANIAGRM